MATFEYTRQQTEQTVMVNLLTEIERNPSFTQRGLASELNIALGLMNQYLKRCLAKGWIRASQVSPHRISYFLTHDGFVEKSLMVKDYLARSLSFFRDARTQCEEIFDHCKSQGFSKIALVGDGDLSDIARLVNTAYGFSLEIIFLQDDLTEYDAVVITDVIAPQETYDLIKNKVASHRVLAFRLLHISR